MKNRTENYLTALNDLRHIGRWLGRKMGDRLQGREYVFTREDFLDLSKSIRYTNWLSPRVAHQKWYQKMMEGMFGPVENPKIRSRIIPLNAQVKKSKNAVLPQQLIDDFIDSAGFMIVLDECLCRKGMECKDYPVDFGCLMFGEGARTLLKGNHGRVVTAEEAKKHVREAAEAWPRSHRGPCEGRGAGHGNPGGTTSPVHRALSMLSLLLCRHEEPEILSSGYLSSQFHQCRLRCQGASCL